MTKKRRPLRGIQETATQHADSVTETARAFKLRGWSVDVLPNSSHLTMRIGTTNVCLRDERRQTGDRICVEYEERGRPAGPFRSGESTIWIHLLRNGAAASPGWWLRDEVTWRREYRSTWDAKVGDSGGRAVLLPVLAMLMRTGEPFHMAYGNPFESAPIAFESVIPFKARGKAGA